MSPRPWNTIVYVAPVYTRTGYGTISRAYIQALHQAGVPLAVRPIGWRDPGVPEAEADLICRLEAAPVEGPVCAIFHMTPSEHFFSADIPDVVFRVNISLFETDRLPQDWIPFLNRLDQVWVPTQFHRDVYATCGVRPELLRVIPFTHPWIDSPLPLPVPRADQAFRFLNISEFTPRKRLDVLLAAYFQEFAGSEPVELYLKITYPKWVGGELTARARQDFFQMLSSLVSRYPRRAPLILDETLGTPAGVQALIAAADAYVSTDGEGYTLPVIETMACGRLPVSVDWCGGGELVRPEFGFCIPASNQTVPVPENVAAVQPLYRGHRWAEIRVEDVRRALRSASEASPETRARMGEAARAFCEQHMSRSVITEMMLAALNGSDENVPIGPRSQVDADARACERLSLMTSRPISPAALEEAAASLTALLSAPDIVEYAEANRENLTPTFFALLTLNAEQAVRDGSAQLAATLANLHEVLTTLRQSVCHSEGAERPKDQQNSESQSAQADFPPLVAAISNARQPRPQTKMDSFQLPSGSGLSAKWDTPLLGFSGYCWMARTNLSALDRAGVDVQVNSTISEPGFLAQLAPDERGYWRRLLNKPAQPGVYVSFAQPIVPQSSFDLYAAQRAANPGHLAYVGLTMFETDRIPAAWVRPLNEMDEVWVPSHFNRQTFIASGVDREKIFVTPSGLDTEFYQPGAQPPLVIPERCGFVFLSVFDWTYRKGWDILLRAYLQAFSPRDDVSLVIRAYRGGETQSSIRRRVEDFLRAQGHTWATSPHILLLDQHVPPSRMPGLYAACDAFVLPSRGEGWGIPFMEAMAMEKPVVAPAWGGHMDFIAADTAYLLPVQEVEVAEPGWNDAGATFFFKGHCWGEPSADGLAQVMRAICADPAAAQAKGRAARAFIEREFNADRPAVAMIERLRALAESRPAQRRAARAVGKGAAQPRKSKSRPAVKDAAHVPARSPHSGNGKHPELRVLFVNRPDALSLPGGDTTHMLRLKEGLEKLGAQVDVCCDLRPEPMGYDVVNVFNLLLPGIALRQACALRAGTDAPIFLTPFYWDRSESLWGEAVLPPAAAAAQTPAQLEDALQQIAAGRLPAGRFTRAGRNRPYADYEAEQRAVLDYVDYLIPISARERDVLAAVLAAPYTPTLPHTVIPTGVDLPDTPASPEPFISQFGVRDFVLVAGRVEPRKNQLMLLLALRGAGLPIVVAGAQVHPAYLDLCRKVAPPDTHFVGRLESEMLASARAAARVHALPSWWETAGIASMEAAMADCNVVMGNRAAESDYFGDAAYYCDPADVTSVRQAVFSAYKNHAADADRRAALSARIRAEYNWDAIAARTLAVYRETLAPTARARTGQWAARQTRRDIARAYDLAFAGDPGGALRELKPHVRPASTNASALTLAGEALVASNRPMQAVPKFQRLAELHAEDGSAFRRWGKALVAAGQLAEAEQRLRRALQLAPDDSVARLHLGQIKVLRQQWAEARELLQSVLADHPNDVSALALLGEACRAQGDIEQARRCYERALSLNVSLHEVAQRLLSLPSSRPLDAPPPEGTIRPSGRATTSRAAQTLQLLLDADDLAAALEQHADRLDANFLDLVRLNAVTARADGDAELAAGLDVLAEYAAQVQTRHVASLVHAL
ncbi:MAG: tetratricopeptide repeat protein [Chloroflexi bacterium]|nr:tetratricopeptide repeat protein [Chloroflexota bacterium]